MEYFSGDIIKGESISLEEFLKIVLSSNFRKVFPCNCFPTIEMLNEYTQTIQNRTDIEVKKLLARLIVSEGGYGTDAFLLSALAKDEKYFKTMMEYRPVHITRLISQRNRVWEGITWILDLLPDSPNEAINVIDAFFGAYCQVLPDNVLVGLSNANEIIRAKYYNKEHPIDLLLNISPVEFECLTSELFKYMGYETELTKSSYDGGIDVVARINDIVKKENVLIQCKRYISTIGVKEVRELYGVVENKKATKGLIFTTSQFSKSAINFANESKRIELISGKEIIKLCNQYFGTNWPNRIGVYTYRNISK